MLVFGFESRFVCVCVCVDDNLIFMLLLALKAFTSVTYMSFSSCNSSCTFIFNYILLHRYVSNQRILLKTRKHLEYRFSLICILHARISSSDIDENRLLCIWNDTMVFLVFNPLVRKSAPSEQLKMN